MKIVKFEDIKQYFDVKPKAKHDLGTCYYLKSGYKMIFNGYDMDHYTLLHVKEDPPGYRYEGKEVVDLLIINGSNYSADQIFLVQPVNVSIWELKEIL